MRESLIEHFFSNKDNGSQKDIKVQIIDYCDPNNPERREDFWIYHLDTIYPLFRKLRNGCFSYFMIITFRNCPL